MKNEENRFEVIRKAVSDDDKLLISQLTSSSSWGAMMRALDTLKLTAYMSLVQNERGHVLGQIEVLEKVKALPEIYRKELMSRMEERK